MTAKKRGRGALTRSLLGAAELADADAFRKGLEQTALADEHDGGEECDGHEHAADGAHDGDVVRTKEQNGRERHEDGHLDREQVGYAQHGLGLLGIPQPRPIILAARPRQRTRVQIVQGGGGGRG
ncbi:MAG: hypothetical protein CMN93_08165 [Synechococcus sp. CPC35]|nr:hypothetical protein [Synechococcus sp. CPC35]